MEGLSFFAFVPLFLATWRCSLLQAFLLGLIGGVVLNRKRAVIAATRRRPASVDPQE
jgi:hypothetical protein